MEKHVFSLVNVKKTWAFLTIITIATLVLFIFFEGMCSFVFFIKSLHSPIAERAHTRYDELLGWVNIPNVFIKNMYGGGIYFRTNSQGFRGNTDFSSLVANGKIRIVCSGDSFTLGNGVDDDHTWCQLLASSDERLEVVNMGQGGYGIDQSYLWYMRDGIKLKHQIHIFAVIKADFDRFGNSFMGYGKPYLKVQNNLLVVYNVPVPARSYYVPWLTENIKELNKLQSIRMLRDFYKSIQNRGRYSETKKINDRRATAIKIWEELLRVDSLKSSTLIVVYLPDEDDLNKQSKSELRTFLSFELSKRKIMFLDLVDDFKELSDAERGKLFIQKTEGYLGEGHYTVKANQYVASMIYNKLLPFLDYQYVKK